MDVSLRQSEITKLVQAHGSLSVEDLSRRFSVTTQTIRRDVNRLCEVGVLRRTHGGVELPPSSGNIHYQTRQILNIDAKRRIAQCVASEIPDGASLAFSIGTTPEVVMQGLMRHDGLRVFTNNLNVAMAASANPAFEVTIVGGRLRTGDRDILGPAVSAFFSGYQVDFGIFGVAGVDPQGTLLDFHEEEVLSRQAILESARQSLLVLDHSKFGRAAHVRGGHIGEVSAVFCDRPPPPEIASAIVAAGTRLVLCHPENGS